MRTSNKGIELIKRYEGCRLTAYRCAAGVPTIGWGHTKGVKMGMKITQAQADAMLVEDLKVYEAPVIKYYLNAGIKLTQNQFDALVSLCYNGGAGAVTKSLLTLVKGYAAGRTKMQTIVTWWTTHYVKGGNKVLSGLVRRRKEEAILFSSI